MARRLTAILAADLVGYSGLMDRDEAATHRFMTALRTEHLDPLIEGHNGRVFKSAGDGLLVEFASIVDSVACALAWQAGSAEMARAAGAPEPPDWRIGISLGDVLSDGDDLFGHAVNVAARLEALAPPGGVLISGDAAAHARGRIEARFDDLGEKRLKNIASPVRIFAVTPADADAAPQVGHAVYSRPAILVLGFDTLSKDGEDRLLALGLADDLRTNLSYWRWFPVIGPDAIGWKTSQSCDLRSVAAEVDATFALCGSLRHLREKVRISANLVEAASGRTLWSDTFEGAFADMFDFQDEVCRAIVARLEPQIARAEAARIARVHPADLDAWHLVARADEIDRLGGEGYGTRKSNLEQIPLLEAAIRRDPGFGRAWSRLAKIHWRFFIMGWSDDRSAAADASLSAAEQAIALDPEDWEAHVHKALIEAFGRRNLDAALYHSQEAVRLNPSATLAQHASGCTLELAGEVEAALEHLERIFRLDPNHSHKAAVLGDMTTCLMLAGRLEDAVKTAQQLVSTAPTYVRGLQRAAAAFGLAGRDDLAGEAVALLRAAFPGFDETYVRETYPFQNRADLDRFIDGLSRAGAL